MKQLDNPDGSNFILPSSPLAECPVIDSVDDFLVDVSVPELNASLGDSFLSKNIFAHRKRKEWDKTLESRCDFNSRPSIHPRAGIWFASIWQKSVKGKTLTEIKGDPTEIAHFATETARLLTNLFGEYLSKGDWAIITTPKRRHFVDNFASNIASKIADIIAFPFVDDVATCRSKERINAVFDLNALPEQQNLIVFDDFVTTGSTFSSMKKLLTKYHKNLFFIAGINNK